jgi:hypothetical protein
MEPEKLPGHPLLVGIGKPRWMGGGASPILAAAQYSPKIALAMARGIPFAPYVLNIRNTFTDSTTTTSAAQSFEGGQTRLDQDTIVDRVVYEIDSPAAFSGTQLKPVSDFFYGLNSGITATMEVQGAPRYAVAPFFTPLRSLCAFLNEEWPFGWVLTNNQIVSMQFQQTVAVPTPPVTVTVSFRMWQPLGIEFVGMDNQTARQILVSMGYTFDMPAR